MFAYIWCPVDSVDNMVKISENTITKSFKAFVRYLVEVFGDEYLMPLNVEDTAKQEDFLECLVAFGACIEDGRTVQQFQKGNRAKHDY
jgi:hypothetical protein